MKLKRFISLLASMAMAVTALTGAMSVSAETDSGDCGEVKWSFDSSTGKLTISGNGAMASPSVKDAGPLADGRLPEAQIDDYADIYTYKKEHMEDIKEVVIEDGVTSIGVCAFYKMPNLETVVLPKTITEFKGIKMTYVADAGGAWNGVDYANYAFAECTKLNNLTLTEGMTAIGGYAFSGCTSLESVVIPKSITTWDYYSFYQCSKLKDITLPEELTVIGGFAFSETAVESVVIPSTIETWNTVKLTKLGTFSYAFANCKKLSSVTFIEGLKEIGASPFVGCTSLKRVAIPASITNMTRAFESCTGVQEVYIEEGAVIGTHLLGESSRPKYESDGFNFSFYNCENLKKLEIASGITTSFNNVKWGEGCSNLQDVYLHGKDQGLPIPVVGFSKDYIRIHAYTDSGIFNSKEFSDEQKINIEEDLSKAKDTLKTKLEEAKALNENDYTAESYAALKTAIENAEKFDENYTGVLPLQWAASDITSATRKLEKKPQPADYTAVDEALAKIPSDLSVYTDETVKALNDAKEAVVRDLTIDEQERVNGFANAIEEAIAGLIKKQNSNTGSDKPQNPNLNNNTNKPNQPTSSKDKGKTPTNKVTVPKPAQVKSVKATAKKKKLNVSWKKVSGATGYEVLYATNNKFTKGKKTVKVKKNKVTLKKLKAKKKYFVKVRAYKKVKGNVNYGKWSKVVKKKTK